MEEEKRSAPVPPPNHKSKIGGQALIEGVMMKGVSKGAMACRLPNGEIDLETWELPASFETDPKTGKQRVVRKWYQKVPLVRGCVNFVMSMIDGYRCMMKAAEKQYDEEVDDFCAWKLAQMSGCKSYEDIFSRHIYNYRNVFDPSDQFFKGRDRTGRFDENFNPFEWGGPFVEGNAWQWRFSIQQDAKGMIDLMGGERHFIRNLDSLFTAPGDSVLFGGYGYRIHEINEAVAGGQGQYAQGNEPCFHVIHLYNHAGQPWKAQKFLRESLERLFSSGPDGFPGDEDGGAMSAWFVFNAMGFYPVTPGVPQYVIGSPLFDAVTINLENGKTFKIVSSGNGEGACYISKAFLDGKVISRSWITHDELMKGGQLEFSMSKEPDYDRGTSPEDRPYSMSNDNTGGILNN